MTINDIARLARVSASTVSKVMNGKDKDISDETKKNVLKVIEENHYVPYSKFREKQGLKNHLIGLVISRKHREREEIVLSVERAAGQKGFNLIVNYVDEAEEILACVEEMGRKQVSGLLIASAKWVPCKALEKTTVYLNRTQKFAQRQKAAFYYRLSDAGKIAAQRLIEEGHQKIACITDKEERAILDGYKQAMHNQNISIQRAWIYEGESLEDIEQYGVLQCLSENATAVICGSKEIACGVLKLMERTRTVVPEALSVIAIGDGSILEILGYGVTAVRLPVGEVSEDAVGFLVGMIQEEKRHEITRKFLPDIVERNTVVCPAHEKQGEKIVVVGSMNMDITIESSRIPKNGESTIVVYQGANRNLSIAQLNRYRCLFQGAGYCLLSMEIPDEITEYTIKTCKRAGTKVILKPSGAERIKDELLKDITYFVPNENELKKFVPGNKSLEHSIGFALYASGITVTRYGVQPALPDRSAVDVYEDEILSKYLAEGGDKR